MAQDQNQGRKDDPTRPPETGLPKGRDVGGIPSTMSEGVDRAGDRAAARREGGPRAGAGEASPSTGEMARGSAATAPRDPRDRTQAPETIGQGDRMTPKGDRQGREMRPPASDQGQDDSGQDDSAAESLGKSISEPFKSS